ncbi:winged helix-turn-helix transcriptional regulator [Chitinophaga silvisoli]|nr:helix-turn-helix domain-containing protein [Chitinophaga silvisoli]
MENQALSREKKEKIFLTEPCHVGKAMGIIKGRWSFPIIRALMNGTMRFKELERNVSSINTRMLVKELKEMEAEGLVIRKAYATVPPTVEYSLTEKGQALKPVIVEIEKWAEKFLQ